MCCFPPPRHCYAPRHSFSPFAFSPFSPFGYRQSCCRPMMPFWGGGYLPNNLAMGVGFGLGASVGRWIFDKIA